MGLPGSGGSDLSAIPFTDRELKRAWVGLTALSTPAGTNARTNPHRLLLCYAVECGLKAVWLKRQNRTVFDSEDIDKTGHNLRQLLKDLRVGSGLDLPQSLQMTSINAGGVAAQRAGDIRILHQVWRYGGECRTPTDQDCETQLLRVLTWIQGELK